MRFIGDIHAKFPEYMRVSLDSPDGASIQLGDFGYYAIDGKDKEIVDSFLKCNPNHRFIRGNHDNPEDCKNISNWIPDGSIESIDGKKVFFLGGAWSIDYYLRTEGIDFWSDEEVSYSELGHLVSMYSDIKPDIVVTHDCPTSVAYRFFIAGKSAPHYMTRTAQALDMMFKSHAPKLWLFGHWHMDVDRMVNGTRFICLNELSYIDIDLERL